jgi:ABC-type transporter Mla subunit MlaD
MSRMKSGAKEMAVGVFVLAGLLAMAGGIVYLGREADQRYRVTVFTVKFPNASGLLKGSKVLMAGGRVGKVLDDPMISPLGDSASITLGLSKGQRIPRESEFKIRSSGFLGDVYIDVLPNRETATKGDFIQPNDEVEGLREKTIGDTLASAQPVIDQTQEALDKVKTAFASTDKILTRIDKEVLDTNAIAELKVSISSLNSALKRADATFAKVNDELLDSNTVASVKASIQRLDHIMEKLDSFADTTAKLADTTAKLVDRVDGTMQSVNGVVTKIEKGEGLAGRLISDKELADDLAAFISNLRKRGVLFYKDEEAKEQAQPPRGASRPAVRGGR